MRKLVFFPSDPIAAYIAKGRSYEDLDNYYNPGNFFDEVYCLSPWGNKEYETIGKIRYIKANPLRFKSIIKKINPDVVRGYGGDCCADWISISKVSNIPTIVSVHDTNPALIHDSLQYADFLLCMSKAVKDAVQAKLPIPDEKIFIFPNRVDVDVFTRKDDPVYFKQLNTYYGEGKHILHVGRKAKQKNLETVIHALQYLDENVTCVFVGQGNCQQYIDLAESLGVGDRCFFKDRVATKELAYWYSWCDCFCTPSRWEGFGMVFIEAASCEAAIVTSNIAPMNEFLTNGENAILVDEYENPKIVAEAIFRVLEGTEVVQTMKKNARKVGLEFEKNKIDTEEIQLYKNAIKNKGKGICDKSLRRKMYVNDFYTLIRSKMSKLKKSITKQ